MGSKISGQRMGNELEKQLSKSAFLWDPSKWVTKHEDLVSEGNISTLERETMQKHLHFLTPLNVKRRWHSPTAKNQEDFHRKESIR